MGGKTSEQNVVDSLMPPPAFPVLKTKSKPSPAASASNAMPAPELPAQKLSKVFSKDSGGAASSLPKDNEVLDDNIWERRCIAREQRANSASSSSSSAAAT